MNPPRFSKTGWMIKLLTVGFYLAGASWASAALRQIPLVSVDVDNGVTTSTKMTGVGAPTPPSYTGGTKQKTPAGTVQDLQSQLVYTITVRNLSSFPASNLTVEYHFYNKTSAHNAGTTTTSVDDVTSTATISLPVNGRLDVQTIPISHDVRQSYAKNANGGTVGANTKKSGYSMTMSTGQTDTTTVSVMGYVIIIRSGNTIIKTVLSKDDIVDQVKTIQARMAAAQGQ